MSHDLTVRFICDRCGFECSNTFESDTLVQPLVGWSHTFVADVRKDLCPACVGSFREWFKTESHVDYDPSAAHERALIVTYLRNRSGLDERMSEAIANDIEGGEHR